MSRKFVSVSAESIRAKFEECRPTASYTDVSVDIDIELSASDKPRPTDDTEKMTDITREEIGRTISGIEDRMDKRIERIEQSENRRADDYRKEIALRDEQIRREMDLRQESFRSEQVVRDRALNDRFEGFLAAQTERDKRIDGSLLQLSESQKDIKSSLGSMKTTVIITAVSTVLAIVIGVVSFNAMLTSNMISAFQMGRSEQVYSKPTEAPATTTPIAPAKP